MEAAQRVSLILTYKAFIFKVDEFWMDLKIIWHLGGRKFRQKAQQALLVETGRSASKLCLDEAPGKWKRYANLLGRLACAKTRFHFCAHKSFATSSPCTIFEFVALFNGNYNFPIAQLWEND